MIQFSIHKKCCLKVYCCSSWRNEIVWLLQSLLSVYCNIQFVQISLETIISLDLLISEVSLNRFELSLSCSHILTQFGYTLQSINLTLFDNNWQRIIKILFWELLFTWVCSFFIRIAIYSFILKATYAILK